MLCQRMNKKQKNTFCNWTQKNTGEREIRLYWRATNIFPGCRAGGEHGVKLSRTLDISPIALPRGDVCGQHWRTRSFVYLLFFFFEEMYQVPSSVSGELFISEDDQTTNAAVTNSYQLWLVVYLSTCRALPALTPLGLHAQPDRCI